MAEHYCQVHKTAFTKKTGKFGDFWSHRLDDGSYCNEPKPNIEIKEENIPRDKWEEKTLPLAKPYQRGSPEERNSIESQVSFEGVIELMVGKIIDLKHPLAHTALNYAASKLGNWSSMGDLPDDTGDKSSPMEQEDSPVVSAEEVIKDLKLIIDGKKTTSSDIVKTLKANSATGTSISAMVKSLSPEGLARFAAKVKPLVPSKLVQEAIKLGARKDG